jgi:hypothetical protein
MEGNILFHLVADFFTISMLSSWFSLRNMI